ncbi:MAG: zinc ribbon domain-containing protein [Anaerolineae bacterium]
MSGLIDKIVEGAGQVISEVDRGGQIQSAISGVRQRMAEADRKRQINRVRQQIEEMKDKEAQAINSLSAQVLALHEAGSLTQPELVSLCKRVDEIRVQIKETEAELEQLQPPPPPSAPTPTPAPAPAAGDAERCPQCGVAVMAGAAFCQSCGAKVASEPPPAPMLFCVSCGAKLREGARFCPKCGQQLPEQG